MCLQVRPGAHYRNGTEVTAISSPLLLSCLELFFSFQVVARPLQVIINVDQGNMIKANCGIDLNGNGNFTLSVQAQQIGGAGHTSCF